MATKQPQQKFENLEFNFTPNEWFVDESNRAKALKAIAKAETLTAAAESLGINPSTLRLIPVVDEDGLIPFRSQAEIQKKVAKERDSGTAWAQIGARLGGMTERRVQRLYEAETEKNYREADIGKGGRPPKDETEGEAPAKKAPAKKAAKKSTKKAATKKAAKSTERPFPEGAASDGSEDEAIEAAILGNVVTVERPGGNTADIEVVEVVKFGNSKAGARGVQVKDPDGKVKNFAVSKIVSIA